MRSAREPDWRLVAKAGGGQRNPGSIPLPFSVGSSKAVAAYGHPPQLENR